MQDGPNPAVGATAEAAPFVPDETRAAGRGGAPLSTSRRWARALLGFRAPPSDAARRRLVAALRREEMSGLSFAFRARSFAAVAVALWLATTVPAPRVFYYLGVVGAFFLLGLIPHLLRRHPFAQPIKLVFIALDVALITAVIIVPPPFSELGWPIQMRLRFHEYLYLLLYLVGSALSYSPLNVVWTGLCILAIWALGFTTVLNRPETVRFADRTQGVTEVPPDVSASIVLDPLYVGPTQLFNQIALTLIITGLLVAVVWRARRTLVRQTRAEVARADLSRYVSPDVADALAARPDKVFGEPKLRRVAVLFVDIVGFTAHAETLPPERVVALLRSFHARACKIIFRHEGTVDKFIGDAVMATFGSLEDDPQAPRQALACAFELHDEVRRWREKRVLRGAPEIGVAVGVHYGPVVVGNVGAERRLEFTVVGDPVNVASRLERLTREHACAIAASRELLDATQDPALTAAFEPKGPLRLRGRNEPVDVYIWHAPTSPVNAR